MSNRLLIMIGMLMILGQLASAEEYTVPIRPGIPAERQFWNRYSTQFMYAPAFDIDALRGGQVAKYRFTAHSQANDKDYVFEADQPFAPLSPIWKDIPVGPVTLSVVALNADGKVLGEVGTRSFYRMPVFAGPYGKPDKSYAESPKWALQFQFNQAHYQGWKEGKRVEHQLNCYPNKMMSAVLFGMARYAKLADKPADRKDALAMATNCARYMMSISFPKGSPMEYWPPTYDPDTQTARERMTWIAGERGQNVMAVFPADAGLSYLDLYDATGEKDFLEAARRIAGTYGKLQLPSGTWPLLISTKTGQVTSDNLTIPTQAILLMDRLEHQYGVTEYKDKLRRAVDWVFKNPMENYFWQGQFEDIRPSSAYINLSHKAALAFAIYLFNHEKEHPEYTAMAEELLRFSEDQFVVWEPCGPKEERITPCALEQYRCYGPIVSTMARFIIAWTIAYNHTGKDEYLAKAQSLANSIVAFQAKNGGQYRTWLFTTDRKKNNNWDNAATEAAMAMLALNDAVTKKQNKQ